MKKILYKFFAATLLVFVCGSNVSECLGQNSELIITFLDLGSGTDPALESFTICYNTCPGQGEPASIDLSGVEIMDNVTVRHIISSGTLAENTCISIAGPWSESNGTVFNNGGDCANILNAPASVDAVVSMNCGSGDSDCTGSLPGIEVTNRTCMQVSQLVCCDPTIPTVAGPPVIVTSESTCAEFGGTLAGGVIAAPTGTCPPGSTVEFATDGMTFSTTLPMYDQTTAITVTTRCVCDDDPTVISLTTNVTTVPGECPLCLTTLAATVAPGVEINAESTCAEFGGTLAGGALAAPATACPAGSTLEYSLDGGAFSTTLPMYDQMTSVTVTTRCICDADPLVISMTTDVVTTPGECPLCLTTLAATAAPGVEITAESTCAEFGGTLAGGALAAPATACPAGSTLEYSLGGGAFSTTLPMYDQMTSVTVTTRCICDADPLVISMTTDVVTTPGECPLCLTTLATTAAPGVEVTESTCTVIGGTADGGSIAAPVMACPVGSTLEYSLDGGAFSTTLPLYDQMTSVTVTTRCICDLDPLVISIPTEVVTVPGECPPCEANCRTFPANPTSN